MAPLIAAVAAPPSSYAGLTTALAVLMLVIEFGMLQAALLRAQIRLYAAQSVVISVLAVVVAFGRDVPELYALAAFSVLLKVVGGAAGHGAAVAPNQPGDRGQRLVLGSPAGAARDRGRGVRVFRQCPVLSWAARCCRPLRCAWRWPSILVRSC